MTVYFSVDVETTGTNPFDPRHQLATVGAVAVLDDGLITDNWYSRLEYEDSWDPDTREWWMAQNATARNEMMTDVRLPSAVAAMEFVRWVGDLAVQREATFVANPATFDHAWVLRWLTEANVAMPFHYRTLCLRSADWGRNPGPWGNDRNGHKSKVLHHALHDAQAQALDLLDLL